MASGLKDLKLWQEAVILGGEVFRGIRQDTRKEHNPLADALMLDAASVGVLIAEGHGRYDSAEQQRCYRLARGALAAAETRLAIARQGGLLSSATAARLTSQISIVNRLLAGYLTYLERQIEAEEQQAARGRVVDDRPVRAPSRAGAVPPAVESLEQVDSPQSRE